MLIENVVTILKGVNHFSIQRIVFPAGAKMLIFGHDALSKFNAVRLPWQPDGKYGQDTYN